jgi:hypothetical protein
VSNEKPILFKDDMIRAILEGRKTQTRRIVKPQPEQPGPGYYFDAYNGGPQWNWWDKDHRQHLGQIFKCPYGKPGDRLWVRETFSASEFMDCRYRADGQQFLNVNGKDTNTPCEVKWTPSIHMPRWASRITLEITDVRVERLQDISEEDAIAEGAQRFPDLPGKNPWGQDDRWSMEQPNSVDDCLGSARSAFGNYFCKLAGNAPKGIHDPRPWDANPWVWVIKFKRIDREAKAA